MVYQLPAARPLYFYQNDIIDGKVSQHVFMPCYSVAIKPGLLRTPLFFMVKSERDIRKFTSSYSFNRLVVLMKNNSDFPTFSNQSRCTKKFNKGEDREERGGSGQAVPPCFMFHLGLNGMQVFLGFFWVMKTVESTKNLWWFMGYWLQPWYFWSKHGRLHQKS